ncbi:MAG TPA: hypothetical protein EYP14_17270, partial [Planctomycetaceae bacterium]|nr:hypothetical protein [Planctomycetaceae bacterium]
MEYGHLVFRAWQSKPWLAFCIGSAVLAIVLIVVLLRYERRLVPRSVGNTLLVLRTAVVIVLLLTLLEPVLSWTVRHERSGRLLVAVDVSDSMSTTDNHASKAEKLRWARSLGMIGNPAVNRRLDQWIDAWERGDEPQWVGPEETADPQRRAELARLRRETLQGIFAELDKIPRKEIAVRLLTKTSSPLLKELQPLGRVDLRLFAGERLTADPQTLAEQVHRPAESALVDTTDLSAGLAVLDEADADPVLGVVVFTDGRHNAGRDPLAAARLLGSARVPVFPVLLGSELRPRDLSIGDLDYPPTVFKDDHPLLKVTINTSGFEQQPVEIVLEKEGDESARQTRRIIADGQPMTVEFELNADDVGRHKYTVRTAVQPDE